MDVVQSRSARTEPNFADSISVRWQISERPQVGQRKGRGLAIQIQIFIGGLHLLIGRKESFDEHAINKKAQRAVAPPTDGSGLELGITERAAEPARKDMFERELLSRL